MICNFGGWPHNVLNTPEASSVFPRNLIKELIDCAGQLSVVLIFDICNVSKMVTYD